MAEIARLVPPAAAAPPPLPGAGARYHYNGPSGSGEATAAEIVAQVRATPGARHLVWTDGMASWAEAASVPELAAMLAAPSGPPPLPGGGPPPLP